MSTYRDGHGVAKEDLQQYVAPAPPPVAFETKPGPARLLLVLGVLVAAGLIIFLVARFSGD